jgi:hypothetical protein
MTISASQDPFLEPEVVALLQHHSAEVEFQTACELTREFFPERRGIKVSLLDDPDEEGHTWVVL